MFGKIERNFRHEPLEVFAVKFLANSQLLADVSRVDAAVGRSTFVDVLGVFVHPHIGHTTIVLHKTMTIEKSCYSKNSLCLLFQWNLQLRDLETVRTCDKCDRYESMAHQASYRHTATAEIKIYWCTCTQQCYWWKNSCTNLEGEFVLLSTPDIQTWIVTTQLPKPFLVDRKKTASHDRTPVIVSNVVNK